jgi:hypothetical protein
MRTASWRCGAASSLTLLQESPTKAFLNLGIFRLDLNRLAKKLNRYPKLPEPPTLARAGRRDNQRVAAGANRGPAHALRRAQLADTQPEPTPGRRDQMTKAALRVLPEMCMRC